MCVCVLLLLLLLLFFGGAGVGSGWGDGSLPALFGQGHGAYLGSLRALVPGGAPFWIGSCLTQTCCCQYWLCNGYIQAECEPTNIDFFEIQCRPTMYTYIALGLSVDIQCRAHTGVDCSVSAYNSDIILGLTVHLLTREYRCKVLPWVCVLIYKEEVTLG